jgi:hypothetical protein
MNGSPARLSAPPAPERFSVKPLLLFSALLSPAVIAGCNRAGAEATHAHDHTPAATFKEGYGVKLSERGAAFVALKTTEVASRTIGDAAKVVAIPAEALLRTVKGDFVFVAKGEWFLRTPITLGRGAEGWLGISAGVYEGDHVVVNGVQAIWLAEVQAANGGVGSAHGH